MELRTIAIGYSAGGLLPLTRFFDHSATGNAAYFLLHHMPLRYLTCLPDILRQHTRFKVVFASNMLPILPNHIYLLPPDAYVYLAHNRMFLKYRREMEWPNRAFTIFLRSLVASKTDHVVAVFLSGGGDDGVQELPGLKAIGAVVIAQSLDTCKFPGMPGNAIDTGHVDHIMSVEEMGALICTI